MIIHKNYFKDGKLLTGFTLVELIISIAIFLVLIIGAANLLVSIIQNPKAQLAAMDNIDRARFVSSNFINEIRAAAYGSYPLIEAENSEIIFYSPVGASSGNVNRIRYYVSGDTLYKAVIVPVNGIYNLSSEVVTPVLTSLSNGGDPLFYYYNGSYNGVANITPLSQPVNVVQVKFVKMNLTVKKQITAQDASTFSLNAGTAIRVLKNNLSN